MSVNDTNMYDVDARIAEIYDQVETQTQDVALVRRLIGGRGALRILEPFCGGGRMLIPLAADGHELVGMDQSRVMLDSARAKLADLAADVRRCVRLTRADVTAAPWPDGFDLVLLGANCFYELATAKSRNAALPPRPPP